MWKHSELVLLLKPIVRKVSSFLPLCLLDVEGKFYEHPLFASLNKNSYLLETYYNDNLESEKEDIYVMQQYVIIGKQSHSHKPTIIVHHAHTWCKHCVQQRLIATDPRRNEKQELKKVLSALKHLTCLKGGLYCRQKIFRNNDKK